MPNGLSVVGFRREITLHRGANGPVIPKVDAGAMLIFMKGIEILN